MIVLEAGDWRVVLNPGLGGSLAHCTWRRRPVLRPTLPTANGPLDTACFPLVPYANRIDNGRFTFGGRAYALGSPPGFEPHALHGLGWRSSWAVETTGPAEAALMFQHRGDGEWPWDYSARQRIGLSEAGLQITLSMTSEDGLPQPAGLGLHPYLQRLPGDRLTLLAPRVWRVDETQIPRDLTAASTVFDWSDGAALPEAPFTDHTYEDWDGTARLVHPGWGVTLTSPGARRVHVYAPQNADFICVEPVSHRPDALNAPADEPSGLAVLQPGQTLSLSMTIGAFA